MPASVAADGPRAGGGYASTVQDSSARGVRQLIPGSFDAEALARTLAASGLAWCWLDGEAAPQGEPSVSYFGITEHVAEATTGTEHEFLALVSSQNGETLSGRQPETAADSPAGFYSGWVAALSYEFGVALMDVQPTPDAVSPAFALQLDAVLALTGSTLELRSENAGSLAAWQERYGALIARALDAAREAAQPETGVVLDTDAAPATSLDPAWRRSSEAYERDVREAQRAITRGDAYVLCLTDTATVPGRFDPVDVYTRLRRSGTAVRGGIIAAGGRALVSASPERFLTVRGREVSTHPIKGTRPRSDDPAQDRALAADLASDPKERAENLMIVDLMRNDLSRVCEVGTVVVPAFLRVEQHPHVHQLVSSVTGRLRPGAGVADAVAACFPGGSMTGAPKRRAVELLAAIEGAPRGLYSGCFGWIDARGDAELAMTIRGVELRGIGGATPRAFVGAGGGVTADSDPALERAEKDLKAASLLAALA